MPPDLVPELSNPHSTRVHTNFYTKKSPKDLFHPEASNLEFISFSLFAFISFSSCHVCRNISAACSSGIFGLDIISFFLQISFPRSRNLQNPFVLLKILWLIILSKVRAHNIVGQAKSLLSCKQP